MSFCPRAMTPPYRMEARDRAIMRGAKVTQASGVRGMQKRRNPYVPILRSTEASRTDPAVGASTWAAGSQVWKGNMGHLMAKARAMARKAQNCSLGLKVLVISSGMEKVPPAA